MPPTSSPDTIERSLVAYQHYQILGGASLMWFPILFLFFLSRVDLQQAVFLGVVYFLTVVVFEVPSGWLSDRYKRVRVLQAAAAAWLAAGTVMVVAGSVSSPLVWLVVGQMCFALGWALVSGTDSSYHYETLDNVGRADEFEGREARIARLSLLTLTAATIVGGGLSAIDLRLAFVGTVVASAFRLLATFAMHEPARPEPAQATTGESTTDGQLRSSLRYLRAPLVAWLFLFLTVQQPLEGLAFDNAQPWLRELTGEALDAMERTPLYAGLLVAAMSLVASVTAGFAPRIRDAVGLKGALVGVAGIEVLILLALAATRTWLVLPLIALRSMQHAVGAVLVPAAVAPEIESQHRATFLSLGSFSGRLLYGASLWGLASVASDTTDRFLWAGALVGAVAFGALLLGLVLLRSPRSPKGHP